jgi:UDP-N-acetylmuramoyl-tripeptide--D-alanyl-D-alanine ligase
MTIDTACQITNGQIVSVRASRGRFRGASVDTRTLRRGNAFFCLRGAKSDGHRYARLAARNGAGAIIAESGRAARWRNWPVPVIGVDDPLTAMGDLAAEFRRLFPTRYVAVTGSVGKTTTKEMIAAALGARFAVYKSPGNYNNLIGIPLALLARNQRARDIERYGVLEFGMSSPGEIARLTEIVKPQWGVLTRIAPAHLLQMRSLAAIAKAKHELFDHSAPSTIAFLNNDDTFQRRWQARWKRPTITYAVDHDADFVARRIETTPHGEVTFIVNGRFRFEVALAGSHNVGNALAAIAVARHLGVPFADLAAALREVRPVGQRSRITHLGDVTLIEDCYNANPLSTVAALESLAAWPGTGRRIAVLGAMRELGPTERAWHRRVGRAAGRLADVVVTVGDLARQYVEGMQSRRSRAQTIICRSRTAAAKVLDTLIRPGDIVLFKASHSEQFEEIVARVHERSRGVSKH